MNKDKNKLVIEELSKDQITGFQIDSLTIHTKVRNLLKLITSDEVSDINKIKISNFLSHTLCDYIKLSNDKCDIIVKNMIPVIMKPNDMLDSIRLNYLSYKNEYISFNISSQIYQNNVKEILAPSSYFQIIKHLLRSNRCNEIIGDALFEDLDSIFRDPGTNIYSKMEIADIHLLNSRVEKGNQLLDEIRLLQRRREEENNFVLEDDFHEDFEDDVGYEQIQDTIYSDTQNVHNSVINLSVIQACIYLITLENCPPFSVPGVKEELQNIYPDNLEAQRSIDIVLERIQIDAAVFRHEHDSFTLHNLFSALWSFICKHENRTEIKKILVEEMISMSRYCSTGHLSRFINVIQGFHNLRELDIKISNEEQIKAVVMTFLNLSMSKEDSDEINDSIVGDNKKPFLEFVKSKMNEKIPSIISEYNLNEEEVEHILNAVKKYTKFENWILTDNIINFEI
jgi:hypothetical protein